MTPRRRPLWLFATHCFAATAFSTGCYTSANGVQIPPLETRYPVSASPSYLARDGLTVVQKDEYRAVRTFSFEQSVPAPRHTEKVTQWELGTKLDQIVSDAHGDAATNVRIQPVEYDPGSHAMAASLKQIGWMSCIPAVFGLTIGGISYAHDPHDSSGTIGLAVGGTAAAIAALSFLVAPLVDAPTEWTFRVSGVVVETKPPAAASAAPEGGPDPDPPSPSLPSPLIIPTSDSTKPF